LRNNGIQILGVGGVHHHWSFKLPLVVDGVGKKSTVFVEICFTLDSDKLVVSFSRDLL
jgi:hypothetical protein